jgi:hypothetical protein
LGQVRLTGEIRDEANNYYRDSLLDYLHGVKVYLYSDGDLLDSCSTDYGTYGWEVTAHGIYSVATWVVPAHPKTVGPIVCGEHSCDTPDTLVLGRRGDISLYPNPFAASAAAAFELEASSSVLLTVRYIDGTLVRTLVDGTRAPGHHTVLWDGNNDQGAPVPPGPYWVVLRVEEDEYRYVLALVL